MQEIINNFGQFVFITSFLIYTLTLSAVFVFREIPEDPANPKRFRIIVWPAKVAQTFFNAFWGKVDTPDTRFRALFKFFTWRSAYATLIFSVSLNVICILLILFSAPPDSPRPTFLKIQILFTSEIMFLFCNFLGDFVSVNITRFVLHNITTKKRKNLRYIALDALGIILGYGVMLLPGALVLMFGPAFVDNINDLLEFGLLGNALMPFFLFVFAFSDFPSAVSLFALFSVFSITIPTAMYLGLIIFTNVFHRLWTKMPDETQSFVLRIFQVIKPISAYSMVFGGGITAVSAFLG